MGANSFDINSLPGGGRLMGESAARQQREATVQFDEFMRQQESALTAASEKNTAAQAERDRAAEEDRRRGGRGRASTLLTSPLGVPAEPSARRVLLGGI